MYFDYSLYVRACLVVPAMLVLFALILFVCTGSACSFLMKKKDNKPIATVKFVLAFLIISFFLCRNAGILAHGGISLLFEREEDAVVVYGHIQSIEELGAFSFPKIKTEYGYANSSGVQLTIDGVHCKASTNGSIQAGDIVTVVYLPKSGYILYIGDTPPDPAKIQCGSTSH